MKGPISGDKLFESLVDKGMIIMAANMRYTPGLAKGVMKAAKETNSAIIFEIARTESDIEGGYTGMTPADYSEEIKKAAEEVDFDMWVLHADHIGIKKGTREDIENTKKLIDAQIEAGFTSFAIDASHLFNFDGKTTREELAPNIDATIEIAKYIQNKMGNKPFGLEVEVGEIGRKDENGFILTTPEEAVTFIKTLNENGIYPHFLATSNGSTHGNLYDENGNPIEQVSIDIERTKEIAKALRDNNLNTRIAQHGITGTPRDLINTRFPKGDIIKGNVATFWQNILFDTLKVYDPKLYKEIFDWVIETYGPKNPGKRDIEIFGKNSKYALKHFFRELHTLDDDMIKTLETVANGEARIFFRAFGSSGSASMVRAHIE